MGNDESVGRSVHLVEGGRTGVVGDDIELGISAGLMDEGMVLDGVAREGASAEKSATQGDEVARGEVVFGKVAVANLESVIDFDGAGGAAESESVEDGCLVVGTGIDTSLFVLTINDGGMKLGVTVVEKGLVSGKATIDVDSVGNVHGFVHGGITIVCAFFYPDASTMIDTSKLRGGTDIGGGRTPGGAVATTIGSTIESVVQRGYAGGMDIDDRCLIEHIAVHVGEGEIAVLIAVPAPVEMELLSIVAVAVAYKCVSATTSGKSLINHRTTMIELIHQYSLPFGLEIMILYKMVAVYIAKMAETFGNIVQGSAAARGVVGVLIVHADRNATVIAQQRDGINLSLVDIPIMHFEGHVGVIIDNGVVIHRLSAIVTMTIGTGSETNSRIFPIADNLSHSRGYTAYYDMVAIHRGAVFIISPTLSPFGLDDGVYILGGILGKEAGIVVLQGVPLKYCQGIGLNINALAILLDSLTVGLAPVAEEGIYPRGVIGTIEGISEDGFHLIVGTYHNKTLIADIENIDGVVTIGGIEGGVEREVAMLKLVEPKIILGNFLCSLLVDRQSSQTTAQSE